MKKFCKFFMAVALVATIFNSCTKKPQPTDNELVGYWQAYQMEAEGETWTDNLEYVYIQFNADGTCFFNLEGLRPDDDVYADYTFANNKITLVMEDDEEYSIVASVEKLTATELVLNFPKLEANDPPFTIYYVKAQ